MKADEETPVVIKVGGSLLNLPDLAARLSRVFQQLHSRRIGLVTGGGPTADLVREWDSRFALGESAAHWLAIRSLRLNESLMGAICPQCAIVESWDAADAVWNDGRIAILSLEPLLRAAESCGEPTPPHCWRVTSDSLAAWAATRLHGRLVLAKSIDRPTGSLQDTIAAGDVDACFPDVAGRGLAVDWINLREPHSTIEPWRS